MRISAALEEFTSPFRAQVDDSSLSAQFSKDQIALASDKVLTAAGAARQSCSKKSIPWIVGWRAIDDRIRGAMVHPSGEKLVDRRLRISEFVEKLSDHSVWYCLRTLDPKRYVDCSANASSLERELHLLTYQAERAAALSILKNGGVMTFAWKGSSFVFKKHDEWTRWKRPPLKEQPKEWRFLITDELLKECLGVDTGGYRNNDAVKAEKLAITEIETIVDALVSSPAKSDVVGYLMEKFPALSKKAAFRAWDLGAPSEWKRPGRRAKSDEWAKYVRDDAAQ